MSNITDESQGVGGGKTHRVNDEDDDRMVRGRTNGAVHLKLVFYIALARYNKSHLYSTPALGLIL